MATGEGQQVHPGSGGVRGPITERRGRLRSGAAPDLAQTDGPGTVETDGRMEYKEGRLGLDIRLRTAVVGYEVRNGKVLLKSYWAGNLELKGVVSCLLTEIFWTKKLFISASR